LWLLLQVQNQYNNTIDKKNFFASLNKIISTNFGQTYGVKATFATFFA